MASLGTAFPLKAWGLRGRAAQNPKAEETQAWAAIRWRAVFDADSQRCRLYQAAYFLSLNLVNRFTFLLWRKF